MAYVVEAIHLPMITTGMLTDGAGHTMGDASMGVTMGMTNEGAGHTNRTRLIHRTARRGITDGAAHKGSGHQGCAQWQRSLAKSGRAEDEARIPKRFTISHKSSNGNLQRMQERKPMLHATAAVSSRRCSGESNKGTKNAIM